MGKIEDGDPAFPCNSPDGNETYKGMTLRQWYAGMALQGLISNKGIGPHSSDADKAHVAFDLADAMIAHEKKENNHEKV